MIYIGSLPCFIPLKKQRNHQGHWYWCQGLAIYSKNCTRCALRLGHDCQQLHHLQSPPGFGEFCSTVAQGQYYHHQFCCFSWWVSYGQRLFQLRSTEPRKSQSSKILPMARQIFYPLSGVQHRSSCCRHQFWSPGSRHHQHRPQQQQSTTRSKKYRNGKHHHSQHLLAKNEVRTIDRPFLSSYIKIRLMNLLSRQ